MEYRVDTPEAVSFSYAIAGIGSRFAASLLDIIIEIVLLIVIFLGTVTIAPFSSAGGTVAGVLLITLIFMLVWGYYLLFEAFWHGQTPGKFALHVRVIKASGHPIGFTESAIRNLLRIVDWLPSFYALGVITMFIDQRSRRLGDLAAGTVVVKVPKRVRPSATLPQPLALARAVTPRGVIDPDEMLWNLRTLSTSDLTLVERFLDRVSALPVDARRRVGEQIATRIAARIGAREPSDPAVFLRRVIELQRAEEEEPRNPYAAP
jgi:uncharacterized RDD family membrane protein YckC